MLSNYNIQFTVSLCVFVSQDENLEEKLSHAPEIKRLSALISLFHLFSSSSTFTALILHFPLFSPSLCQFVPTGGHVTRWAFVPDEQRKVQELPRRRGKNLKVTHISLPPLLCLPEWSQEQISVVFKRMFSSSFFNLVLLSLNSSFKMLVRRGKKKKTERRLENRKKEKG